MDGTAVEALLARSKSAGLFLDFDGTLSPIVQVPSRARPLPGVVETLEGLERRFKVVAVVSGRSAVQLLEWLGPNIEIWGVHGVERTVDGRVELSEKAAQFQELMSRVRREARNELQRLDLGGVILEDKGVVVSLHHRMATHSDAAEMLSDLADRLAGRHRLVVSRGRQLFELRPPLEFSKAVVVLDRARRLRLEAAAFIGDDVVDLAGFDALDELERDGVVTLRVAVRSPEAPVELLDRAQVIVDSPEGTLSFLKSLL